MSSALFKGGKFAGVFRGRGVQVTPPPRELTLLSPLRRPEERPDLCSLDWDGERWVESHQAVP